MAPESVVLMFWFLKINILRNRYQQRLQLRYIGLKEVDWPCFTIIAGVFSRADADWYESGMSRQNLGRPAPLKVFVFLGGFLNLLSEVTLRLYCIHPGLQTFKDVVTRRPCATLTQIRTFYNSKMPSTHTEAPLTEIGSSNFSLSFKNYQP